MLVRSEIGSRGGFIIEMKANISVYLDKEDNVERVEQIENLGSIQYKVLFKSGYSIIIDQEILRAINIRVPSKI
jgi:hypothetical protein